jgi:hypothetical protein
VKSEKGTEEQRSRGAEERGSRGAFLLPIAYLFPALGSNKELEIRAKNTC